MYRLDEWILFSLDGGNITCDECCKCDDMKIEDYDGFDEWDKATDEVLG